MRPQVLFIVGPTACGKSKLAVELAKRLAGEIISADSMQVYKGMDIGTAKPTSRERKNIPHHLMDIFSPAHLFSVYEYQKRALIKIRQIIKRGKIPIVVGGSGLYVRSLLQGLSGQPGADFKLRKKLEEEASQRGLDTLYQRLQKKDPERAAQINPNDQKRILRALEILEASPQKPSEWHQSRQSLSDLGFDSRVIGITKDRQQLYSDIEKRVDQMFRKGLVKEVKQLMKGKISQTAAQAVGYKELFEFFVGRLSLSQAKDLIKRNTRRFAKRQWVWFKKEPKIEWVEWPEGVDVKKMADIILK